MLEKVDTLTRPKPSGVRGLDDGFEVVTLFN